MTREHTFTHSGSNTLTEVQSYLDIQVVGTNPNVVRVRHELDVVGERTVLVLRVQRDEMSAAGATRRLRVHPRLEVAVVAPVAVGRYTHR